MQKVVICAELYFVLHGGSVPGGQVVWAKTYIHSDPDN